MRGNKHRFLAVIGLVAEDGAVLGHRTGEDAQIFASEEMTARGMERGTRGRTPL